MTVHLSELLTGLIEQSEIPTARRVWGPGRMSTSRTSIAVVDDDVSFARAISRLLRASGFDVRSFESADAFLGAAPLRQPDCLVCDLRLGGMSGLELQESLAASGSALPIVFVTAHDETEARAQAQRRGCVAYLRKPVGGSELLGAIAQAVGKGGDTRAR